MGVAALLGQVGTLLLAKIVAALVWIGSLFVAVFAALWLIGQDGFCWIMEQMLLLIQSILNSLPGDFDLFNPAQYINGLPPEIVNMVGLCRVGEALGIILGAILIKLSLQIIPFTRLGS